jgi:hypothetical protein
MRRRRCYLEKEDYDNKEIVERGEEQEEKGKKELRRTTERRMCDNGKE